MNQAEIDELNERVAAAKEWDSPNECWRCGGSGEYEGEYGPKVCMHCVAGERPPKRPPLNWAGSRQAYQLLEEARLNLDWGGASLPSSGWVYAPDESPVSSSTVRFVQVFASLDELYPAICRAWLAWKEAQG